MTYFFISDLHVDFYAPLTRTVPLLRNCFEKMYQKHFLQADVCCIAGDIANNYFTYVEFLKFIAEKYSQVYLCFGNHDIIAEHIGSFGADKDFPTSQSKIEFYLAEAAQIPNLHLLENRVEAGHGLPIGGCLGMCDWTYRHTADASMDVSKVLWKTRWFDGRHWNYMDNDPDRLWEHYRDALSNVALQRPKIMMSHFLPVEFGMAERFVHDPHSTFFYFKGAPYLELLDHGSIYQAGHTHTAIKKEYVDSLGKSHLLLCHPVGYPTEKPYEEYGLSKEDFLIEL